MSIVMSNGAVDGHVLVGELLTAVGLTAKRVRSMRVEHDQLYITYFLVDGDGRKYIEQNGDIALREMSLPIDWSRT